MLSWGLLRILPSSTPVFHCRKACESTRAQTLACKIILSKCRKCPNPQKPTLCKTSARIRRVATIHAQYATRCQVCLKNHSVNPLRPRITTAGRYLRASITKNGKKEASSRTIYGIIVATMFKTTIFGSSSFISSLIQAGLAESASSPTMAICNRPIGYFGTGPDTTDM